MIQPPIEKRALQSALKRLYDGGLIRKAWDWLPQSAGNFYALSQMRMFRGDLSKMLGIETDAFRVRNFNATEVVHNEMCAVWATKLQAMFPEAEVIRDFRIMSDPAARDTLLSGHDSMELLPDILLRISRGEEKLPLYVAFEVERSCKEQERYTKKLYKFASETCLDGVVYLCKKQSIIDRVLQKFDDERSGVKLRINQYRANFLLLGLLNPESPGDDVNLYNAEYQSTSLKDWVRTLLANDIARRRDHQFSEYSPSCTS